jgi:hypothetical protein
MNIASTSTASRHSATLVALRSGFWRVVHPGGRVLGYIEQRPSGEARFTARRLVANTTRLVEVGEFWSIDDASACFSI